MIKPKLLFLDDEIDNLDAIERLLRKKFQVFKASTPNEAFNILDLNPDLEIIISDQRMPLISGAEFLEKSIMTHPESIRILLTGYTDVESIIEAINKGQIYKYITKPWDPVDLQQTLDNAYEKLTLRKELKSKNQALTQALQELELLDKAKSQFMILINHELKTPLTSILSFASLLKESNLNEEQNLFTDRILKSSDKLKNIIDDVLLIVKGELNQIPTNKQKIFIEDLFLNLPSDLNQLMTTKNQTLTFKLDTDWILADPTLMKTLIHRGMHNAIKFGLAHSTIEISSITINSNTTLQIKNKGPRISESVLNKILKPFTLDENVMNHSVGMGLGLTICQTLMKAHLGVLHIENTDDGVLFKMTFPN